MELHPTPPNSSQHQGNNPAPSMPAKVSQVVKLLNSYDPTITTEKGREWKQEEPDTSLSNKIQSIAQMLRLQKAD